MKKKRNRQHSKILITLTFSPRGYSWSQTPTAPCAPPWPGTAGWWSPSRSWTTPSWSGSTTSTRPPRSARRLWRMSPRSRSQTRSPSRGPWMTSRVRDLLHILQLWRASRCGFSFVTLSSWCWVAGNKWPGGPGPWHAPRGHPGQEPQGGEALPVCWHHWYPAVLQTHQETRAHIQGHDSRWCKLICYIHFKDITKISIFFQDTVSVHRPGFYAERFLKFMTGTTFKKIPSCK